MTDTAEVSGPTELESFKSHLESQITRLNKLLSIGQVTLELRPSTEQFDRSHTDDAVCGVASGLGTEGKSIEEVDRLTDRAIALAGGGA